MNLALGRWQAFFSSHLSSRAAFRDQRMRPATEQDLPEPVLPRIARCRPNSLSGSTRTGSIPAVGQCPRRTRPASLSSSPVTIACNCSLVGNKTGEPTDGKTSTPRCTLYLAPSPIEVDFKVPMGVNSISREGNGRSTKSEACCAPLFLCKCCRSMRTDEMMQAMAPLSFGINT